MTDRVTTIVVGVLVLLISPAAFLLNPSVPIRLRPSEAPYAVLIPDPADVHTA